MIKKELSIILKSIGMLFIFTIVGYLALVLVYCIPESKMTENALASFDDNLKQEQDFYYPAGEAWDNYSDGYRIAIAAHTKTESVWKAALNNSYYMVAELFPGSSYYAVNAYDLVGSDAVYDWTYSRYWHGYLLYLKPLLCFFPIAGIRNVIVAFQISLLSGVLYLLVKKGKEPLIIPTLITYIFMNPIATASMNCGETVAIYLIAMLCILITYENMQKSQARLSLTFLCIGAATSYFDFLSSPFNTFCIPVILFIALTCNADILQAAKTTIRSGLYWGLGYLGFWGAKWGLAYIVVGPDALSSGMDQLTHRISDTNASFLEVLKLQLDVGQQASIDIALLVLAVVFIVMVIKKQVHPNLKTIVIFLILTIMPLAWYFLVRQHSSVHQYMTFRVLGSSLFALLTMFSLMIQRKTEHKASDN